MGSIKTQILLVVVSCVMGVIAYVPPPPAQLFLLPDRTETKPKETLLEKHNDIKETIAEVNTTLSKLSVKVDTIQEEESVKDAEMSSQLKSMSSQQQTLQQEIRQSVTDGAEKEEELKSSLDSMKTRQEEFERNISRKVDEAVAKDDELSASLVSITSGQNDFKAEISKSVENVMKKDEEIVSSLNSMKTEQGEFNGQITKAVEDGDSKVNDIEAESGRIRTTQTRLMKKVDQVNASLAQMVNQLSAELKEGLEAQEAVDKQLESTVNEVKKQMGKEELKSSLDSMKTRQEEFERNISRKVDEAVAKDDELSSSLVSVTSGQNDFKAEINKSVENVMKKVNDIEAESGRIRTTQTELMKRVDQLNASLAQMVNQLSAELKEGLEAQEAVDQQLDSTVNELKKQMDSLASKADPEETPGRDSNTNPEKTPDVTPKPSKDVTPKPSKDVNPKSSKGRSGGISSCLEIKKCLGSRARDSEYWMYPSSLGGKKIKVWCHNMAGTPQEYITLPEENEGHFPNKQNRYCSSRDSKIQGSESSKVGETSFRKIKIDIDTMVVDRSDSTFAHTKGAFHPYGYAGDCYTFHYFGRKSSCGPKGSFKINLEETGLRVKPSLKWKVVGHMSYGEANRDDDNSKIRIRCGGGCGGCEPDGDMVLEINPSDDDVDDDDVISVSSC